MSYLQILPNPFNMNPVALVTEATAEAAPAGHSALLLGSQAETGAVDLSHDEMLEELARLIEVNNESCEDDRPLFLRRSA